MTLEVQDIHVFYGKSHVIQGATFEVPTGGAVALLGRNGAGKTTTMRTVAGQLAARSGKVLLDGRDISSLPAHRRARSGIAFVASGKSLFEGLTVHQNLAIAASTKRKGPWSIPRVMALFPQLEKLRNRRAGVLSGGERQMMKVGQALLTNPTVLLLDEPTEGLAPVVVSQLLEALQGLVAQSNLTLLLSEQNVRFAMSLVDECYVLQKGTIRYRGPIVDLLQDAEFGSLLGTGGRAADVTEAILAESGAKTGNSAATKSGEGDRDE